MCLRALPAFLLWNSERERVLSFRSYTQREITKGIWGLTFRELDPSYMVLASPFRVYEC